MQRRGLFNCVFCLSKVSQLFINPLPPVASTVGSLSGNKFRYIHRAPSSSSWFSTSTRKMGDSQSVVSDLPETNTVERKDKVRLSDEEWKQKLSSEQFTVCRRAGTQRAWEGDLLDNKKKGIYSCSACGFDLFSSSTKFDSGSGWPSFFDVIKDKTTGVSNVEAKTDSTHGMTRTEVLCGKCDSHLGHVFNDGPKPSGLRFCINSISLKFRTSDDESGGSNL